MQKSDVIWCWKRQQSDVNETDPSGTTAPKDKDSSTASEVNGRFAKVVKGLILKPDLSQKANFTEWVKINATAEYQKP